MLAENGVSATAKATGVALKMPSGGGSSPNIGAAVALNYVDVVDRGMIGDRVVIDAGDTVTVTANTPAGLRNDFTAWGLSAAGGSGAGVAGSVAVQVLLLRNEATIGEDVAITTDGGVVLSASNPMGLQSMAASGALSTSSAGVGAAIVVNVIDADTIARIGSTATHPVTIDAGGAISLSATSGIVALGVDPILDFDIPDVTSVALAGAASGSSATIGGSLIVDVVNITTRAEVGDNASINQTVGSLPGQSLSVVASDDTEFVELAGAIGLSAGSAGIGFALVLNVINKDVRAVIGKGVRATVGGSVLVSATARESFTMIAAGAAASQSAGVTGSFVVLIINQGADAGTRALIDGGQATPTVVEAGGNMTISATDDVRDSLLFAGGIAAGGSAGVGVSSVVLVRTGMVDAGIAEYDRVVAKGSAGLSITATQSEDFESIAVAGAVGGTAGVAGSATVAVHTNTTYAHIDRGVVVNGANLGAAATQGVAVSASDHTSSLGAGGQLALGGTAGVGAGADVQVITKDTRAWIAPGVQLAANGNVTVDADSSEKVISISAGAAGGGTVGVAVNAAVSVITITTRATIGEECAAGDRHHDGCAASRATVFAGGSARISANDDFEIDIIAGSVAVGGTAGVGAAAAVPVITKRTVAFIGDNSIVQALGGLPAGIRVSTGGYAVVAVDTRFIPGSAITDGQTIQLGYTHGLTEGQRVLYDAGGGAAIGGLVDGRDYIVHVVSPTSIRLSEIATPNTIIGLTPGSATGQSHRVIDGRAAAVPASESPYFDPAASVSGNSITLPYSFDFVTGDKVIYSSGGGTAIGGLVDGATYTAQVAGSVVTLLDANGAVIALNKALATGRAHSLVAQGRQPSPDAATTSGVRTVTGQYLDGFVGVAVTATSTDDIAAVGASAAGAGIAGVAVGGTVNVVTTTTTAFIGRIAQVDAGSRRSPRIGARRRRARRLAAHGVGRSRRRHGRRRGERRRRHRRHRHRRPGAPRRRRHHDRRRHRHGPRAPRASPPSPRAPPAASSESPAPRWCSCSTCTPTRRSPASPSTPAAASSSTPPTTPRSSWSPVARPAASSASAWASRSPSPPRTPGRPSPPARSSTPTARPRAARPAARSRRSPAALPGGFVGARRAGPLHPGRLRPRRGGRWRLRRRRGRRQHHDPQGHDERVHRQHRRDADPHQPDLDPRCESVGADHRRQREPHVHGGGRLGVRRRRRRRRCRRRRDRGADRGVPRRCGERARRTRLHALGAFRLRHHHLRPQRRRRCGRRRRVGVGVDGRHDADRQLQRRREHQERHRGRQRHRHGRRRQRRVGLRATAATARSSTTPRRTPAPARSPTRRVAAR